MRRKKELAKAKEAAEKEKEEQFYKLMEELFIPKAFFMIEYDRKNPTFSPGSYINQALAI